MRGLVAADAPTPPKTLALVEAKPDPEVLIDIEPTGPTPEQITRALVGAYAEAWRDSAGVYPPDRKCAAIGRNVKPLIAEGWAPPVLLLAVQRAGAARNLDVDGQLGTARAAYDRSGSSRQALFAAWDTRITKGIGS